MNRKGIFFMIDAIIAASLILGILLLTSSFYIDKKPQVNLHFYSSDLLKVLKELKIQEVQSNNVVQGMIEGELISNLNNSLLDQMGEFWSEQRFAEARNLSVEFTEGYLDSFQSFEITFDGEVVYNETRKNRSEIINLVSSLKFISGISRNKTKEGFVARSAAKKVRKNTTLIFPFAVGGSAHDPGDRAYITKKLFIPAENEDDISNASFYISISHGTSSLGSQNQVKINEGGGECEFGMDTMDIIETLSKDGTNMAFGIKDEIIDCLNVGWNEIELTLFVQSSGHGHLHPGTKLFVSFEKEHNENVSKIITKKVYFDNILSTASGNKKTGAWAIMPVFRPKDYNFINATLFIHGKSIRNVGGKDNIQIYINNDTLHLTDPPCSINNDCDFNNTYNLSGNLVNGTNVVSVYLNSYEEEFWGKGDTILYSDPENDAEKSSYVEYTYEITNPKLQFGKIDIFISEKFNNQKSTNITHFKNLNDSEVFEASIELVQIDSDVVTMKSNGNQQFNTPKFLATPNSIFINPETFIVGANAFQIEDSCVDCYILNYTSFYYSLLVPSLVGYGATFQTELEAKLDARLRLEAILGEYVSALEIDDDVAFLGNVPSLWGPTLVKVSVWG